MVDALASGASGRKAVEVRVLSWAPIPLRSILDVPAALRWCAVRRDFTRISAILGRAEARLSGAKVNPTHVSREQQYAEDQVFDALKFMGLASF